MGAIGGSRRYNVSVLEILGYMFAVYAGWRILAFVTNKPNEVNGIAMCVSVLALFGIVVGAMLINRQAEETRDSISSITKQLKL